MMLIYPSSTNVALVTRTDIWLQDVHGAALCDLILSPDPNIERLNSCLLKAPTHIDIFVFDIMQNSRVVLNIRLFC